MKCCLMDDASPYFSMSVQGWMHLSQLTNATRSGTAFLRWRRTGITWSGLNLAAVDASNNVPWTRKTQSLNPEPTLFAFSFFLFHLTCFIYIPMSRFCFFSPRSVFVTSNLHPLLSEIWIISGVLLLFHTPLPLEDYWIKEQMENGNFASFLSCNFWAQSWCWGDKQMFSHVCLHTKSASCCSAV